MSRLRIQLLAATALIAAASFAGGTAASASAAARPHVQPQVQARAGDFPGVGDGTGATALAAKQDAIKVLHGDYSGCDTPFLKYDTQNPDGTWSAEVTATCEYAN